MAYGSKVRSRNTDRSGRSFSKQLINQVWQKGKVIPGRDRNTWRHDICGTLMNRLDYGNNNSKYGWEVDHIKPISLGGGDELSNLQPLQWENNRKKGDSYPWRC